MVPLGIYLRNIIVGQSKMAKIRYSVWVLNYCRFRNILTAKTDVIFLRQFPAY